MGWQVYNREIMGEGSCRQVTGWNIMWT